MLSLGLSGDDSDAQARFLEAQFSTREGVVRIANLYLPNGNPPDTEKYSYKIKWMQRLLAYAHERLPLEEPLIIAGDFNVIPEGKDASNPEAWVERCTCFCRRPVQHFRALTNLGLIDAVRATSDAPGTYTFWDYQAGAWQKNRGIRIDHMLLSPQAADHLSAAGIDKHVRAWERPSDHVPVFIDLAMSRAVTSVVGTGSTAMARPLAAAVQPALDIRQRERALVFRRLLEGGLAGSAIQIDLVARRRSRASATSAPRGLARHMIALEQHARASPAPRTGPCSPTARTSAPRRRIVAAPSPFEIEPRQMELSVGIAEDRTRHRRTFRARDRSGLIGTSECRRDNNVRARQRHWRRSAPADVLALVVAVAVGDAAEIFERAQIVLRHAVALGVHAAELPLRQRVALLGGVLKRGHRLDGVAFFERLRAGAERFQAGGAWMLRWCRRSTRRPAPEGDADHTATLTAARCPHNTFSARRRDG